MTSSPGVRLRHLALIGMMGSGKSVVGRRAAESLSRAFVDLDAAISAEAGEEIPAIFQRVGEPGFRELESAVLERALASAEPTVIATGGGVVVRPANRELLRQKARVVWLRATSATLIGRVRGGRGRPMLRAGNVEADIRRLSAERDPLYAELADAVIDVDEPTTEEVVAEVIAVSEVAV